MRLGNAFGTEITIHHSWFWLLPLTIYTLVSLTVEPLLEATIAALLLPATVLIAALAQLAMARRVNLKWQAATLFPVGAVIDRRHRSRRRQERTVALAPLFVHAFLASLFGLLALTVPAPALSIELQVVALFNGGLLLFSLLLRLSPNHDNLLHALLASRLAPPWPNVVLDIIHTLMLIMFATASVFALGIGWLAFGWWLATAVMLSQLTTVAERVGDYDEAMPQAPLARPAAVTATGEMAEPN